MALLSNTSCFRYSRCIFYLVQNFIRVRRKSISVELDAVDTFTTQLMQSKANKWEALKLKNSLFLEASTSIVKRDLLEVNIDITSTNEISEMFKRGIADNHVEKINLLIEKCKACKLSLCDYTVYNVLSYFAQSGNIDGVKSVQALVRETNCIFLEQNSDFNHYLAEAVWIKGNIPKALLLFKDVYDNNKFLRRRIRWNLRYLFYDATNNHSEAIMISLVKFTKVLAKEYNDYYPMAWLWQSCFLSEWFIDQTVAMDLLENHVELLKVIKMNIPFVLSSCLKNHKTEPVYRLLEILLKCEYKMESSVVLVALFDYKFRQGDMCSCVNILKWSTDYKIMLPSVQHEKFLKLLLNVEKKHIVKKSPPDYSLQF